MESLAAPAWVIALATAFFLGAKAVVMVRSNGKNGHTSQQTAALQAVTVTLTALAERLQQLPTREELKDVAEKNRHDYRNSIQSAQGVITEQIIRSETNLTRILERSAQ